MVLSSMVVGMWLTVILCSFPEVAGQRGCGLDPTWTAQNSKSGNPNKRDVTCCIVTTFLIWTSVCAPSACEVASGSWKIGCDTRPRPKSPA